MPGMMRAVAAPATNALVTGMTGVAPTTAICAETTKTTAWDMGNMPIMCVKNAINL